ncbi:hypothetical protein EYF80_012086 [Liparis tanakae]|uniref:Uncharacterized protein n=1 Tax=Liparis tanakae TaxID=230148 RepID=A0A4Z2IIZ0_9TELE|nr:hypothetical protein EYF80_012086 [Liparis tanakae]
MEVDAAAMEAGQFEDADVDHWGLNAHRCASGVSPSRGLSQYTRQYSRKEFPLQGNCVEKASAGCSPDNPTPQITGTAARAAAAAANWHAIRCRAHPAENLAWYACSSAPEGLPVAPPKVSPCTTAARYVKVSARRGSIPPTSASSFSSCVQQHSWKVDTSSTAYTASPVSARALVINLRVASLSATIPASTDRDTTTSDVMLAAGLRPQPLGDSAARTLPLPLTLASSDRAGLLLSPGGCGL